MQKGDVVLVDFTAKELVTGSVFETTMEAEAKKAGVFTPRGLYKPVPMVIGKREFFPVLDKIIESMNVGEEKIVEVEAKDAFGERRAENIALLALQEFKKQKMNPIPGMVFEADGRQGKIQSISGGRVRVDFNHPLAGKKVEYKLVLRKRIEDKPEQLFLLLEKFFPHVKKEEQKITIEGEKAVIELPARLEEQKETELLKQLAAKMLPEQLDWLKTIEFAETKKTEAKAEVVEKESEAEPKKEKN